jgi:hypothetical protein
MGDFAKQVRYNKIPGPNRPSFKRADWEAVSYRSDTDTEDKRIAMAGLYFDNLLTFIRSEKNLSNLTLTPSATVRILVGLSTIIHWRTLEQAKIPAPKPGERPDLIIPLLLQKTMAGATGQLFPPDELITGLGDGLKYILRELQSMPISEGLRTEYEAKYEDLKSIRRELDMAVLYNCVVEFWLDCVGNSYGLINHRDGLALVPFDPDQEIARIVSDYRRQNYLLQDEILANEDWHFHWPNAVKRKWCEIPLVSQIIYAIDRIERIELGQDDKVLDSASSAVAAKLMLRTGYYKNFLNVPLKKLHNFTLNEIINGWQLLQSLSRVIFDSLSPPESTDLKGILRSAPTIARKVLCSTFSKALNIKKARAQQLIDVFVFGHGSSQEVWTQPLVYCEGHYCLVIPCILSVKLQRIVEGWMRQGGLELERRGPEFEHFCREELQSSLARSPIERAVTIIKDRVQFSPPKESEEEIDLVIIVGNAVLLVELKCILWPTDALQMANYRDTIEDAVKQIKRKRDVVLRNYKYFSKRVEQLGYASPESPKIIACVLTNSEFLAGFSIEFMPIVDLVLLRHFFENEHINAQTRGGGRTIEQHSIQFYKDKTEAVEILERYLRDPPQLWETKQIVIRRDIVTPIESPIWGKLIHQTFQVEMDVQKMFSRYGITP